MLDIALIRKDPEYVKAQLAKREYEVDFTELLKWDARRKEVIGENEALKAERNRMNKQIPVIKKQGGDLTELMAKTKEMGEQVKRLDEEQKALEAQIEEFVAALPNLLPRTCRPAARRTTRSSASTARSPRSPLSPRTMSIFARIWG